MAPPVNKPGHPRSVTVLTVPMEKDVTYAQRGFRVKNVKYVLRGSRETVARIVLLVSKVMTARNVHRTITQTTAVIIFI